MAMKRILKEVKKTLNVTSYRLSKLSGISQSLLSAWHIHDSQCVSLKLLSKLRKAAGLSWDEIGKIIDGDHK